MRILHAIHSVDPVYGGTVEALMQLVEASRDSGQDHEILSVDDPARVTLLSHSATIHAVGPARRFYGNTPGLDLWLKENMPRYDCAVIHGCWQYHGLAVSRACKRLNIPYFQYTHGMLDPWFKSTYPLKHLKKWLYWPWAEYRILKNARNVIFTCEEEKRLAAQSFWLYKVNPVVIPLGIKEPELDLESARQTFLSHYPEFRDRKLITFMSRIHLKKGLELLLDAANRLQQDRKFPQGSHNLVIAGPCEDAAYLEKLKQQAEKIPRNGIFESIHWLPMVQGEMKWGLLASSEAFILPSHQENFGMVVAESLCAGTPVLLSDKVNVWREILEGKAGLVESDTIEGTQRLLENWLSLTPSEKSAIQAAAKPLFDKKFEILNNAQRLFELLEKQ